ncbi:ABC transporter ATP-binding protein/permease [Eubacteriales bacterium OttesenSCG-928-M02]|nr:ABC transporter ATP-binding protein/permease [Eubacteriales bacterium OttesenSCG-928-M02]
MNQDLQKGIQEQEYTKKFNMGVWRRLLKYVLPYRRTLITVICANIAIAIGEIAFPLITRYVIDHFVQNNTIDGLPLFTLGAVAVAIYQALSTYVFVKFAGKLEVNVSADIRQRAFMRLQELDFSYYDKTPVGYLMSRLTSDVHRLSETLAWSLVDILWAVAVIVGASGAMLYLNATIALYVLAIIPPLFLVTLFFQKRIFRMHRIVRRLNSMITGSFNEGIMGAKTTKTLVREKANLEEFGQLTGQYRQASIKSAILNGLYMPCVLMLSAVGIGLVLWQGGVLVADGVLWFGTLSAFISFTNQFFHPLQQLANIFTEMQSAQAAAERVLDLIDTEPAIVDKPEAAEKEGTFFQPKKENWPPVKGKVEFQNVSFQYSNGTKVLEDFSLTVEPGQTIALVGETGAGKSTIVNLLCRFYEATSGEILIDGENIQDHTQIWLQSNLGYVLQQPHLFSGTIRDNIRYANVNATQAQVERAAKIVHADAFIDRMAEGYDTQVGEGGNRLSTGEKQLVSFARALLNDPPLFVLDEATSSVDTETELLVQKAIAASLQNRTSFIIAHRLSTIRHSDLILVIRGGQIQEQGTHDALMEAGGYYYRLYTNQFNTDQAASVFEAGKETP